MPIRWTNPSSIQYRPVPSPSARRALQTLSSIPQLPLGQRPTAIEALDRLRDRLGGGPRLLVKRDDAIGFAFGGNKVRKLAFVGADAAARKATTLITAGGVQSNHARVTAATAVRLGMNCVLVVNAPPPPVVIGGPPPAANARLNAILGAWTEYVDTREQRAERMEEIAEEITVLRRGRPYVIPVGASVPLGALGYVDAMVELSRQIDPPDVIVHATSSAGTQAGIVAGCRLLGWPTRVIGVSADDPAASIARSIDRLIAGIGELLGAPDAVAGGTAIEVDDTFVGEGYGIPTRASEEAIELTARTEALFLDPTYTAKAMAALIAYARAQRFDDRATVLFWHTGGQVGLFA